MDQANGATQDELQAAINSITGGGGQTGAVDMSQMLDNSAAGAAPAMAVPEVSAADLAAAMPPVSAPAAAPEPVAANTVSPETKNVMEEAIKAAYGDPDLARVKASALSDLRPILETVDIPVEKKFMIYKEIIDLTDDKACIELAYNAAKQIEDDRARAEALLYIVDAIDRLGIAMKVDENPAQQKYLIQENTTTPPVVFLQWKNRPRLGGCR